MKKYELTAESITFLGRKLFRIKALVDVKDVKAGDLGGYVEKEENLIQEDAAWIYGDAKVCGDAEVCESKDYATVQGFGSCFRVSTFFRCKDKLIRVACGCFYGTIPEFREKVRETHGDSKTAKEYLMIADLMEYRFSEVDADEEN